MTDRVSETIRLAFLAKENQYRTDPHFRMSSAGPLTWLHCVPGWHEVDVFYTRDMPPGEVTAIVGACRPHSHHMISILSGPALPDGVAEEYARLGYQPLPESPQPLMRRNLSSALPIASVHEIVSTEIGPNTRRYMLMQSAATVSTAEVVWVDPKTIYVFAMQTMPEYRRLGLATALLRHIHWEAAENRATKSILWSSPFGLPLYRRLSYEIIATQHGFIPGGMV